MAEPAREHAPAPGPVLRRAIGKIDPVSPGWASVQLASASSLRILALSSAEAVSRPDDLILREMLQLAIETARELGEISRRCNIDETVLAAREQAAFDEGVAWCKANRCSLEVVRGG